MARIKIDEYEFEVRGDVGATEVTLPPPTEWEVVFDLGDIRAVLEKFELPWSRILKFERISFPARFVSCDVLADGIHTKWERMVQYAYNLTPPPAPQ